MPRYPLAGITSLSQLTIDADKNWQVKGITNLKEVAASMAKGDFPIRSNLILVRFAPGPIGFVLVSGGPGHLPAWAPAPGPLKVWIPAWLDLTHAEAIVPADQTHNENAPITSEHEQAYGDAPADYIKRLTPAILCPDAQAIVAADQTYNKNAGIATLGGGHLLIDGAVADDGGAQVNETAVARSAAPNDMTLLPGLPVAGDAYYFGCTRTWDILRLNIGQAGAGTWTFHYEYWNGAWVALPGVVDNTDRFRNAGINELRFTRPGDWALHIVQAMNLYWIRCRVNVFTAITVQPLGTQAWCEVTV